MARNRAGVYPYERKGQTLYDLRCVVSEGRMSPVPSGTGEAGAERGA
jgi:hypothetical protein